MRFILGDELPRAAQAAIAQSLRARGEDPAGWAITHAWSSGQGYAVCVGRGQERRALTVVPATDPRVGFEAWDVTDA